MKRFITYKNLSIASVGLWLIVFVLVPITLVFMTSFLSHTAEQLFTLPLTLQNYRQLIDPLYLRIFLNSVLLAGGCTALCLLLGYPFAYLIANCSQRWRSFLLILVILPFWMSTLIRTYAIMAIIKAHGLINTLLIWAGIIHQPLQILYSNTAVLIGLVYDLLPFMILPLYASIEKLDVKFVEAAKDLGASKTIIFAKIIIPLTKPGIIAGILLVFLPAMTMFYIPTILGGAKSMLLGNLIQNQFLEALNWPEGAAISSMLVFILLLMILVYWRNSKNSDRQDLA